MSFPQYPIQVASRVTQYGTFSTIIMPDGTVETMLFNEDERVVDYVRSGMGSLVQEHIDAITNRLARDSDLTEGKANA